MCELKIIFKSVNLFEVTFMQGRESLCHHQLPAAVNVTVSPPGRRIRRRRSPLLWLLRIGGALFHA